MRAVPRREPVCRRKNTIKKHQRLLCVKTHGMSIDNDCTLNVNCSLMMVYRGFPHQINCDDLGKKLTDDFATVGHLVLHEYT